MRRDESGGKRDQRERHHGRDEHERIGALHLEQQRLRQPRQADRRRQADHAADDASCRPDLRSTMPPHAPGAAPSAMRRPISRVRCDTV